MFLMWKFYDRRHPRREGFDTRYDQMVRPQSADTGQLPMLMIAVFAPLFHGQIGPLDELALCVAPVVFVIAVLVMSTLGGRGKRRSQRARKGRGAAPNANRTGKTR